MDYITWLVHIPLIFFLVKTIKGFYSQSPIVVCFYPAAICKLICTILIGYIYLYYYSYPTDTYWINSTYQQLCVFAKTEPHKVFDFMMYGSPPLRYPNHDLWEVGRNSRTYYFFLMVSVFFFISFGNYWIASIYLSLFSFWAVFALANTLAKKYPDARFASVVSFLFWPTILVWSSGIFKETVMMICIAVPLVLLLGENFKRIYILYILICLWGLFLIRVNYMLVYTPLACVIYLMKYWKGLSKKIKIYGAGILVFVTTIIIILVYKMGIFSPYQILQAIVANNHLFFDIEIARSNYAGFFDLKATFTSFIYYTPKALWVTFFVPNVFNYSNILMLPSAILNTFLLVLTGYSMVLLLINKVNKVDSLVFIMILYVLILAVFLSLSTPNLGTLERYKVGILPFYIFMILQIICRYDKIYFNKDL